MDALTLLMGFVLSVAAAVVPTGFWGLLVWWCDRYEREPLPLLAGAFLWGAIPAVVAALIFELVFALPPTIYGSELLGTVADSSVLVPIIEEIAKAAALLLILLIGRSEFDDTLDGLLYGALIGFGFAMTENLFYYMGALFDGGWASWGATVFLRGVVFGLNHALFTAFTGAAIGYARGARSPFTRAVLPWAGLAAAMVLHAVHNLGASLAANSAAAILVSLANGTSGLILVLVMIVLSLRQERQWIRTELAEEVGTTITDTEYRGLQSLRGRWEMSNVARKTGGVTAAREARRFQEMATELAFRKFRLRRRINDRGLAQQVAHLRGQLVRLRSAPMQESSLS